MSPEEEGATQQYQEQQRKTDGGTTQVSTAFEIRESFFARLGRITDEELLKSPEAAMLFPASEFIAFANLFGAETAAVQQVTSGGSYGAVIVDGLLVRLATWIRLFREQSPRISLNMIGIPVMELHAPAVHGAWLEYAETEAYENGISLALKVGGVGAGGSAKGVVKRSTAVEVEGGSCKVMMADMQASIQFMLEPITGKEFAVVEIRGVDEVTYPADYDNVADALKEPHYCTDGSAYERVQKIIESGNMLINRDFHSMRPDSIVKPGIVISRSRTYEFDLALDREIRKRPGAPPLGAALKITSQVVRDVSARYTLVGGHDYFSVYKGPDHLPLWWPSRPKQA